MQIDRKIFFRKLARIFLSLLLLSIGYLATAATDSTEVFQEVFYDGTSVSGGIVLPFNATAPEIYDFRVSDVDFQSARISFRTDEACLVELYYGRSKAFGTGPLLDHADSYEDAHGFFLDDLESGAKYYLRIVIKNQRGITNVVTSYSFYTLPEFKEVPAVGSLSATQEDETVVLDWENPTVEDFQGVQISRQIGSPALTPAQGDRVFFGLADSFVDRNVADDTEYYYTVFAFDKGGKFSPGAVVSIRTHFLQGGQDTGAGPDTGTETGAGGVKPEKPPIVPGTALVKDVRNLQATANLEKKNISLSWEYAEKGDFSVEIRRDLNFPAMSPLEGERVYEGQGTSFDDFAVRKGQIYFYTVYVKNAQGIYSSGTIIAGQLKETASGPSPEEEWKDMTFVDVASGTHLATRDGEVVDVLEESTLGVSYGVETIPSNLTAVALQLGSASYLLEYDEAGKAFRTSFVVPKLTGGYPFSVVFLNAENEVFFEKNFKLNVLPKGEIYTYEREKLLEKEISLKKLLCRLGNLFGREDTACMRRVAVAGATVKAFRYNEDGIWEVWNAREFNATNPFLADERGRYGVYSGDGKYELHASKEGFDDGKTTAEVTDNILAEDIRIYVKKDIRYGIIILAILLLLVAIQLKKRISYRRKNREEE